MKPLYVLIVVVVVGAGAFFGGMQYQKSQRSSRFSQFGNGQFGNRAGQEGRPVNGQILSMDNNSITVKLNDGSSKIIIFSATTVINKQATGSAADLKTGERVLVIGKDNSDGSVTADSISLNPTFRGALLPTTKP